MWLWIVRIVIFIATSLYIYSQRKKDTPKASALSDFNIPTADASRALPVIFGTVKIPGANVIWYGDFAAFGFTAKGSGGEPVGYYYYLGVDLALCMGPVEAVHSVTFEEKWGGFTLNTNDDGFDTFDIDNTMLFGGNQSGGGVVGQVDVYYGESNQPPSWYLQGKCHPDYPGLSQVCHAVFRNFRVVDNRNNSRYFGGFYWGTQPYLRPVAVVLERCPNTLGLEDGKHRMGPDSPGWGHDANPACILFEILTDTTWGLGLSSALIDIPSFLAAGEVLYDEALGKYGLSLMLERQAAATDFIADVLRHIDGALFADPETGTLVLKLVREDYDPDTLPVFDQSNLSDVEFSRGSWSETYNQVKVSFVSRLDNFTPRVAQGQNLSNLQMRGEQSVLQVDFEGLSSPAAASVVVGRLLKGVSYPFAKLRLTATRQAWKLRPADPIKVTWPALGITEMICRVVRPASGELIDGKISLDVVEDTSASAGTAYSDPAPSGWVDPVGEPIPAAFQALLEVPYQLVGGPGRHVAALAARSDARLSGFQVWADAAGGTAYVKTNEVRGFCPTAKLDGAWAKSTAALDSTGFTISDLLDDARIASISSGELYQGVNLALIDNEIIAWQTISGSGATRTITNVLRGVLDTVPADHAHEARVWFLTDGPPGNWTNPTTPYSADGTIAARLLPYNIRSVLTLAEATQLTVALASRALKPLPPGKVRVNGHAWPDEEVLSGDLVVTWAHRHRVNQATDGVVVSQDANDYATAPEGTYSIEVRVDGTLKRTVTGITAATWTWTTAMQTADGVTGHPACTIRIIPVNGALAGNYQERGFDL